MRKSDNLQNKQNSVYFRDTKLNTFLNDTHIQMLEDINQNFIKAVQIDFFNLMKKKIDLCSHTMRILSFNQNFKDTKKILYCNFIKISSGNKKSLITFSSNLLSVIINVLFGGSENIDLQRTNKLDITTTESIINEKIISIIIKLYENVYKSIMPVEINWINFKKMYTNQVSIFEKDEKILRNSFDFCVQNNPVSFCIFFPLSIINTLQNCKDTLIEKKIHKEKKNKSYISLNHISYVELEIVAKLTDFFISYKELKKLSKDDIFLIEKPEKIFLYIDKKPVYLGTHKIFNHKFIIFIEKIIDSKLIKNSLTIEKNKDKK